MNVISWTFIVNIKVKIRNYYGMGLCFNFLLVCNFIHMHRYNFKNYNFFYTSKWKHQNKKRKKKSHLYDLDYTFFLEEIQIIHDITLMVSHYICVCVCNLIGFRLFSFCT